MFVRFGTHFQQDTGLSCPEGVSIAEQLGDLAPEGALLQLSGASFNDGLYRVVSATALESAEAFLAEGFPDFASRTTSFAYDWLGRIFALDSGRLVGGLPSVVMFEPGTGQALDIPSNVITFHEEELITYNEEALASGFHRQWLASGGTAPRHDQCIGYRRPLFLGGEDTIQNLELSDLDVYWGIASQAIRQTRGLPPGTHIINTCLGD